MSGNVVVLDDDRFLVAADASIYLTKELREVVSSIGTGWINEFARIGLFHTLQAELWLRSRVGQGGQKNHIRNQ